MFMTEGHVLGVLSGAMSNRNSTSGCGRTGGMALAAVVVSLSVFAAAQIAAAQQAPPQTAPSPQPQAVPEPGAAPVAAPRREPRGFFEAIGRWFDEGTAGFRSHLSGAKTSIDEFNQRAEETRKNLGDTATQIGKNALGAGIAATDATRDAMGQVAKLPMARVVQGRERCMTAPNGAPDCIAAAETLCRKQGYSTGKSVDFTSAESCPVRTWLGGKQADGECTTVTFVSRAMCQ
jgi:hypothetical protein